MSAGIDFATQKISTIIDDMVSSGQLTPKEAISMKQATNTVKNPESKGQWKAVAKAGRSMACQEEQCKLV